MDRTDESLGGGQELVGCYSGRRSRRLPPLSAGQRRAGRIAAAELSRDQHVGRVPWGGYGANPFPGRLQRLWDQTSKKLAGGFPYSEGVYEDLNKVICSQLYWDPARPAAETVKEYLAFEYSPDVVAGLATVVDTLEKNHLRGHIGPAVTAAFETVRQAEAKLTPQAKRAWRWRIFYLRTLIDSELFARHGRMEGATLKAAFDELTQIYHAQHVHSMPVKPPQL